MAEGEFGLELIFESMGMLLLLLMPGCYTLIGRYYGLMYESYMLSRATGPLTTCLT